MEYTLKIDQFEGPLDLLLHLIKESKMDIFDLKIEVITNQYLDYINAMKEMNLDIASSYLVMASELIELKSKMLLPRHEEEEESEEDPREQLVNRLIEYQHYKDLTEDFKSLEKERMLIYTKSPENLKELEPDIKFVNTSDVSLDDLVDAFKKFLKRQEQNRPLNTKITKREITVEERRKSIKKLISSKKRVRFFELFDVMTREYLVVTFLAILEMAKTREISIHQDNNFEDIVCEAI